MIYVTEVQSAAELCGIRREWSDLWERCPQATLFASPEWLLPWTRHLFGGGQIWSIAAWERDRLIGLAPLFIHGVGRKQLSFLGSGVTDYLDFLADAERTRDAVHVMWDHLRRSDRWNCCELVDVPPQSPLFDAGVPAEKSCCDVCPVVTLLSSVESLDATLSSKFRHNLHNSRNRVRDLGMEFEISAPDQDPEYIDALFRLHSARWRERGETGVLASAEAQDFLREAALEVRRRGWLRLAGLRQGVTLRGVACLFATRGRWLYYLGGFDNSVARFSPGNLLIHFSMEQAIREGAREFDFLRQGEAYKYKWGAQDRTNTRLVSRPESSAEMR